MNADLNELTRNGFFLISVYLRLSAAKIFCIPPFLRVSVVGFSKLYFMRYWITLLLFTALAAFAQSPNGVAVKIPRLPDADAVRIREFYTLAIQIEDRIWPGWSKAPAPLLLITQETEFLSNAPALPNGFTLVADGWYARARVLPVRLQATAPFFGPPAVMAVGEPENTESKTSTPWLITLMHEHFHQLQWAQPGYQKAVDDLGLSHGDATGMWMLNYPFPYEKPELAQGFAHLRDLLLAALTEPDGKKFTGLAQTYVLERKKFMARLSTDDHKYLAFQLWQEGIARYTQIKAAEAAADYKPGPAYVALPDYESFSSYATKARSGTLDELRKADLTTWKRLVVYSFGGAEGLLLDRMNPKWKDKYFQGELSTDSYFEVR